MRKNTSGNKTMLMSVLMSSPGPLVVGLGLLVGQSSTQLADFVRRSAELLAIIVAFIVYTITNKMSESEWEKKAKYERLSNQFVGAMMCISGIFMMITTFWAPSGEKGNVIPGLSIAIMGVIANTLFWRKYTKLGKETNNAILLVQARLYRAKSLVDICVTTALLTVALLPGSTISYYFDIIGSIIVEIYLIWSGVKTVREATASAKLL